MLYAMRDFRRYQGDFVIRIARRYYDLLAALDSLHNQDSNYRSTVENRERNEMFAQAGRLAEFEVDQTLETMLKETEHDLLPGIAADLFRGK